MRLCRVNVCVFECVSPFFFFCCADKRDEIFSLQYKWKRNSYEKTDTHSIWSHAVRVRVRCRHKRMDVSNARRSTFKAYKSNRDNSQLRQQLMRQTIDRERKREKNGKYFLFGRFFVSSRRRFNAFSIEQQHIVKQSFVICISTFRLRSSLSW